MDRLQKIIANRGYCSRRKAEILIQEGKVKVNGTTITELGYKPNPNDDIEVEGIKLNNENKEYYLLYKPKGVISTTNDDKKRKTVVDLIDTLSRIYPVGRLDYDTTGIILLTNDGELANLLMHPSNNIDKVYIAKIAGIMSGYDLKQLKEGIIIDGIKTAKAKVKVKRVDKVKNNSIIELTIHEGRNHQVKRMFEALNYNVIKLKRERIAFLDLKGLKPGEYRHLAPKEVKQLYYLINKKQSLK